MGTTPTSLAFVGWSHAWTIGENPLPVIATFQVSCHLRLNFLMRTDYGSLNSPILYFSHNSYIIVASKPMGCWVSTGGNGTCKGAGGRVLE